jgi:anti-sigma-K factor RskA
MSVNDFRSRMLWIGWIAAGALLLIATVAAVYAANLRNQVEDVQLRLVDAVTKLQMSETARAETASALGAMQTNLALLSAPDTRVFRLVGKGTASDASGRAFFSRTKGLLFSASKLPPLADGSIYQLWLQARGGPASAGLARPMADGSVVAAYDPTTDAPDATGFAVSVEPEDGSAKPTSEFLLTTAH